MIRINNMGLTAQSQQDLDGYQNDVDSQANYALQVDRAKSTWSTRNRTSNSAFREVRQVLTDMCRGNRRCMYCEDSLADEVEHVQPKDLYPDLCYRWENYLYACGPCNGPKNNKFSVINPGNGQLVDVTRSRGGAVVPPVAGNAALINPRFENPLDFLMLDLQQTFHFTILPSANTVEYRRAEFTLDLLKLNERDYLVSARRDAFIGYFSRLNLYVVSKLNGAPQQQLDALKESLQRTNHPTVWEEIKRQRQFPVHQALNALFQQAPEALSF